jgi:hypothetical protein
MRVHFSRLLLVSSIALTTLAIECRAQNSTSNKEPESEFDMAFTFNASSANQVTGSRFWMEGAGMQAHDRFLGGLGVVADIAGTHTSNINSSGVGLDMITATFGPRYTWHPRRQRFDLYGQGLVGEAFAFNSVFPAPQGAVTSDYGLAVLAGGGMNLRATPHLRVRVFEADWFRTQLPNTTTNVQNNLRIGAGIVFKF